MPKDGHYIFLTDKGNDLPEDERVESILIRKLWKLIDQAPHACGIRVESLRELLRDPEAFDA